MPTNVVMPQMGESIAEGTIVRWIKNVGDRVERDEPLFEISTDKVDAEIPSPAEGVLREIKVKEGETVPVDSVVAVIDDGGEAVAAVQDSVGAPASSQAETPAEPQLDTPANPEEPAPSKPSEPSARQLPPLEAQKEERRLQKSSPLVRRIAAEHGVDLARVRGTGLGGRVTKEDILAYVERRGAPAEEAAAPEAPREEIPRPAVPAAAGDEIVPMTPMRRKIAEHMVLSRRTSAHVHSVFEVDFTQVHRVKAAHKAEYERAGTPLTYMAFIAKATIDALRAVPVVNASVDGDNIVYRKEINLGIAVALEHGLIVPVVKRADEKNVLGLSRAIADVATRARSKGLKPEDVQGGTFTITNPGVFGTLFGMPIINQPQVAILGVGAIEKRPVVIDDGIAIRLRGYLTLGYDHRLIDGAVADTFMSHVKRRLETFDEAAL